MNGLQLAHALRARNPRLGVVVVSGYSLDLAEAGVPSDDGVRFLGKPFDIDALLAELEACLSSR